jgi:hypothetical protein
MAITKLLRCYVRLFRFATITQVGTPPDGKKLDRAQQQMAFSSRISVVVNHFSPNMQVIRVWGKFVESDKT